jgi:hypothetical protein
MIPGPDDYVQCAKNVGGQLERTLGENLVSFFVIGSVAQNDVVPGWSDIDSVLVVNGMDGALEGMIETLREEMARKYEFLRSDRGSKLGVFLISLDDLLSCNTSEGSFPSSLNFHDFRFNSKRIAGEDLSRRVKVPEVTEEDVGLIISGYHDILEREANSSTYWKGRNAIISILNAARLSLMMEGVVVTKKRDILEASTKAFPGDMGIIEKAVHLRENWMEKRNDDESLEQSYEDAMTFLEKHVRRAEARRSVLLS